MALFFESWLLELVAVIFTLCAGIYLYFMLCFQYWKKKGIPYLEPTFPYGNLIEVIRLRKTISENVISMYRQLEGHKVGGFYQLNRPTLMIRDPDMIKTILVKDFAHFQDHGLSIIEEKDPFSGNLFMLGGVKWRHLRQKISPAFTPGKIRRMFPMIFECGQELKAHLAPFAAGSETIEVMDILARYTTDVMAKCAFGIQSNSLKNPASEFRTMGRKVLDPTLSSVLRNVLIIMAPKLGAVFNLPLVPRDVTDFFFGVVMETVDHREHNNIARDDILQLLINLKNKKEEEETKTPDDETIAKLLSVSPEKNLYDVNGLSLEQITAQVTSFFIAGFETSSSTIGFCLYEMALDQGIQDKLRQEIDSTLAEHGQLTYEAVLAMEYLDRVVCETSRKYPANPFVMRECTKEYQLPESEIKIELGTAVIIPVPALHLDPRYYPRPDVFDPDRFTEEAKGQRHRYVYLPFGEGPRTCIGLKLAQMQVKIGIASFIANFKVNVCEKNTAIPLVMDPRTFLLTPIDGIKLRISER